MKKLSIMIAAGVVAIICGAILIFWINGNLFFIYSKATVMVNGFASEKSEVYESGNGDYLVFIKDQDDATKTFIVLSKIGKVGIPNRQIPSSYSRSIKTHWFVFSWYTEAILAGTDKLDRNAGIDLSSNEISFKVNDDDVLISF